MQRRTAGSALLFACALPWLAATPAAAQGRTRPARPAAQTPSKAWIGVNAGAQTTTTEFDDRFDFTAYQETATTRVAYPVETGFLFDAGGGVRLWRALGAGLAVSRFAVDGSATTSTSLPHPFFLEEPRQVDGDADGIRREETGIHLQAQLAIPISRTVGLLLAGGPSILGVNQTLVNSVKYSEEYPYDVATFTGVETRDASGSAAGFNAGVDVRWRISRNVAIGGLIRVTRAQVELDASDGRPAVTVDAGGVHVGAGLRFVF